LQKVAEVTDDEMTKKNKRDEKLETTKFTPKLLLLHDDEDDTASIKEATIALRYFHELVVHPSLLSMSTEDGAHRIAIVCDDSQFLLKKGLVQ
jgi:hypothetical protein